MEINPGRQEEEIVNHDELLLQMLRENLADFTPGVVPIIEKVVRQEELNNQERMVFEANRNAWWFKKFHFDYKNKKRREEILLSESRGEERGECLLSEEVLRAIKKGDQETVDRAKEKYVREQRDGLEEIEAIFGLADFITKQQEFSRDFSRDKKRDFAEVGARLQDLTEYQFLFTHLLIKNADDEKWLKDFWATGERVAGALKSTDWKILASGLRYQAAAYWVMQELGHKPHLSHPREDAFKSVDLWGGEDEVMQIKGWDESEPALLRVETTGFPAVEVERSKDESDLFASARFLKIKREKEKFTIKIDKYGKELGKKLRGFLLVIPKGMINRVNGRPSQDLVEFFRQEIES